MPRHLTAVRNQLAFDEQAVTDAALENALEDRQRHKESLGAVRKAYEEAHAAAGAEIAKLELPDGRAIRVGRFRVVRAAMPPRSVAFEAKAHSRLRITLIGDEE